MPDAVTASRLPESLRGLGDARRLLLVGHPRPLPGQAGMVHGPKDLLLALLAAQSEAAGVVVEHANPHFLPVAELPAGLAVLHGGPLASVCPLPGASNLLLLDGEDLLLLAEERLVAAEGGLSRRRVALMDRVLSAAPAGIAAEPLLGRGAEILEIPPLAATPLRRPEISAPQRWMDCVLDSGSYNFLGLAKRLQPATGSLDALLRPGIRRAALGFATPATLAELAPAMRAFAALPAAAEGTGFYLCFFGTPEELAAALAARPAALSFGDNFRCSGIRILFAPFDAAALLAAMRDAAVVIESVHGGVPGALTAALGGASRIVMGPDATLDAALAHGAPQLGIDHAELLTPAGLARRRQKPNRAAERGLAELLETLLRD